MRPVVQKIRYIRQRLRELGRLKVVAQKKNAIQRAEELIYPANFNSVITAVKELADYNPENNTFCKPSLALKVGQSRCTLWVGRKWWFVLSWQRPQSCQICSRTIKTIKNFRWKAPEVQQPLWGSWSGMRHWFYPLLKTSKSWTGKRQGCCWRNAETLTICKQLCNTCLSGAGPSDYFQQKKRRRGFKNGVGHLHSKEKVNSTRTWQPVSRLLRTRCVTSSPK